MRVVNRSYVLDGKVELLPHLAGRQCPLCASAMKILGNAASGERIWQCENPACQFGYPVWWDFDEPMLTRLVRQRRQFIRAVELERRSTL